jgi:hypothetical protein
MINNLPTDVSRPVPPNAIAPNSEALPPVLTITDVACFLRCSKAHVCHLINGEARAASRLPSVRLGRRTLVRKESLLLWLASVESSW